MVNKKTWQEFRESGLLWFINSILHMFGWAIVIEGDYNKDNNTFTQINDVYPARVKYRGFDEKSNTSGYQNVSKYLKENIEELYKETLE